jgi:RsiW-degrading membrane proteinase PrsW (M82 family)
VQQIPEIFVVSFAPAIFWLGYFYWKGHYGQRDSRLLLTAFLAGIVAGPVALLLFNAIELAPFYRNLTEVGIIDDELQRLAWCLFAIGPIEELAKFAVVWAVTFESRVFKTPTDGLALACAAALGFASVENWYFMYESATVNWARAVTLPFNHMLFSASWGFGLAHARFRNRGGSKRMIYFGLIASMVYHGVYDYVLLSPIVPDALILPLVALLWLWLSWAFRRLEMHQDRIADPITAAGSQ